MAVFKGDYGLPPLPRNVGHFFAAQNKINVCYASVDAVERRYYLLIGKERVLRAVNGVRVKIRLRPGLRRTSLQNPLAGFAAIGEEGRERERRGGEG